MSEPQLGPLVQRFEASATDLRTFAALRIIAGAISLLAGGAVLLSGPPLPVWLIGLVGVLVPIAWFRKAAAALKSARDDQLPSLSVHRQGFALTDGQQRRAIPWDRVTGIDTDEERLDVVVDLGSEGLLRVEPRYQGVEIHTLMVTLRNAWVAARDSSSGG